MLGVIPPVCILHKRGPGLSCRADERKGGGEGVIEIRRTASGRRDNLICQARYRQLGIIMSPKRDG